MLADSKIVDHFVEQAKWCDQLGSPFTASLLKCFAHDFEAGGIIADLCADWPTTPRKDALGLRLTGALHHAVLSGTAPDLAAAYPGADPDWGMDKVWPRARAWLENRADHVRRFIQSAPQTNETRRSIILLPGFLKLAARFGQPLHLLELGASAGLNQNLDRYNYETETWSRPGSSDVTIRTDWRADTPEHLGASLEVASRAGCDLSPIDLSDPEQVLRLKCYTWPDQKERLDRLDAAIRLAQETCVTIERDDALDWLRSRLEDRPKSGVTVVYHSVFLIYPPREQIAAIMKTIREAGEASTPDAPLAWLCYESEALFDGDKTSPKMLARLQVWPGGEAEVYAQSDGHVTRVDPA